MRLHFSSDWFAAHLADLSGGYTYLGCLLGGSLAGVVYGKVNRIPLLVGFDSIFCIGLGYGFGRIGCFLSGDGCYGIPTTLPWGMAFPNGIDPTFQRVHPTPLYELAAGLAIGWWLWNRPGKPHATGAILGQYLLLSGAARFLVEFIRRNPKVLWGLSNAQMASAAAAVAGLALMGWLAARPIGLAADFVQKSA